ncbi:hypothetical protein D0T11_01310 [Hymenobacter rubripertinctus]|uniref:Uncharacterized protein n=2 Tax=Hymenobacter rubripertinctus TaxID=2029981 RepID=A0A418R888_9BACT|nr:hypothetical protein D0T11_01310 [Hymenobacter rubripertinctus]
MEWLAPPPPGYAVYRVQWRPAPFGPAAEPYQAVQIVAASRRQAHRQVTTYWAGEASAYECLIDGEPYLPEE